MAVRRLLPTRSWSGSACRRARRRCRFTASGRRTRRRPRKCSSTAATSTTRRAARCSTTTWSWSRQNGGGGAHRLFACATERVDPDVARLDEGRGRRARATSRTSSASSNQFYRISRWRVTDDAQMRLSMLKRFIELAHCCRDVQSLHAHVRRRPQPVGRAAAQGRLGEAVDQVGEALRRARPLLQSQVELGRRCARCCAASTKWAWPAFDDARLLNLNKKRREADVLRCVRHCQRGEYVFAPHAEIDRFLWHPREPFDDAQLTALSNLCEPSSSAATNAVDSDAVLAPARRPPATCRRKDARAPAPFRRASAPSFAAPRPSRPHPTPSSPAAVATAAGGSPSVPSRRRRRQPQEPGPQPSRLDARASAVQRHRGHRYRQASRPEASSCGSRRSCCRVGAREDAAAATAATQAMSSEQLNSLALRVAVGKREV